MKKNLQTQKEQQDIINMQQQDLNKQNHQLLQHIIESVPYSITPEKYNANIAIDNEINLVLTDIQKQTNCCRACLVTFHNGRKRFIRAIFFKDEYT